MKITKALIIANPIARNFNANKLAHVARALNKHGIETSIRLTAVKNDATDMAQKAEPQLVIAAGGDGTVSEVVNGLYRNPARNSAKIALAVLPFGTANVLAQDLKTRTLRKALKAIIRRRTCVISPGLAQSGSGQTVFTAMASAGVDSHAVANVDHVMKRLTGKLAYVAAFLKHRKTPCEVRAVVDGAEYGGVCVIASKSRYYGGWFRIFAHADIRDETFKVMVVPDVKIKTLLKIFFRLIPTMVCRTLEITGDASTPGQADGDLIGRLPVRISMTDWKLPVICGGS